MTEAIKKPSYLNLYHAGELARRAKTLMTRLESCDICPRECHCNRMEGGRGFCNSGYLPQVAAACDHHGEEPVISGSNGTGAIFFGSCNMSCIYCQNHAISQPPPGRYNHETSCSALAERMLYLQDELACHNISFVSPSHFVPQLVQAVLEAVPLGLHVPLIYNTNGYDSVASIRALEGIIDIYLPDLKYASGRRAAELSATPDYVARSRRAIQEMYRQMGDKLVTDENGLATRGIIVRHLVLPGRLAGSNASLTWLARHLSAKVTVSIMSQYYPAHHAHLFPPLNRKLSAAEYAGVLQVVDRLGLENGWVQELAAAESYQPHFMGEGHPFSPEQA